MKPIPSDDAYRQAAIRRAKSIPPRAGESIELVSVPKYANIERCVDGAYVDALIWVPRGAAEER